MTSLFILILLAVAAPSPYQPPTWENLIPWMFGFFALIVSSLLYFFTNQQTKKLEELTLAIKEMAGKQDKMSNAIYLAHKVRLLQMAADPHIHATLKEQVDIMTREIEEATSQK